MLHSSAVVVSLATCFLWHDLVTSQPCSQDMPIICTKDEWHATVMNWVRAIVENRHDEDNNLPFCHELETELKRLAAFEACKAANKKVYPFVPMLSIAKIVDSMLANNKCQKLSDRAGVARLIPSITKGQVLATFGHVWELGTAQDEIIQSCKVARVCLERFIALANKDRDRSEPALSIPDDEITKEIKKLGSSCGGKLPTTRILNVDGTAKTI